MRGVALLGLLKFGTLGGGSAYLIVALLAMLEASAFVGLFVPGEVAVLAGGYIVSEGRASLIPMMIFVTVGMIIGDSIGYEIGRKFGGTIQRSRLGRRVGDERWARAEQYLSTKGGRAVFLARFVGVLRALVPALAGVSRMRYRKFLFWNASGALIHGPGLVLLGYVAGKSYERVAGYAGRAGLALLALAVIIGGIAALGRWISRNPEWVRAFGQRILARPIPARLHRRYHNQLAFLARRWKPGQAVGLALTLQLIGLLLAGWAFGSVVRDVVTGDGSTRLDLPATRWVIEHRTAWLTDVLTKVTHLGGAGLLVVLVGLVGLIVRKRTGNWTPAVILITGVVGAVLLSDLVKPLVGRSRPSLAGAVHGDGFAFPSGHATQSTVAYGGLAYLAAGWMRTWSGKVAVWTGAVALVAVIGFSRFYLGLHWITDVLGGYALGAAWLAAVLVTTSAVQGAWNRRTTPALASVGPGAGSSSRRENA